MDGIEKCFYVLTGDKPLGGAIPPRSGEVDRLFGLCNPMVPVDRDDAGGDKTESESGQGGIILVW